MRALNEIATRLWQTRATVQAMQRRRDQGGPQGVPQGTQGGLLVGGLSQVESSRLLAFKSALHLLAWVLEIDLDQLDAEPLLASEEQPRQVQAHRVEIESTLGTGARCLWLTDLEAPSADSVGLTSSMLACDRLAYRYIVQTRAAIPWAELRGRVSRTVIETLERYGEPSHWWVVRRSLTPFEFALDQTPQLRALRPASPDRPRPA